MNNDLNDLGSLIVTRIIPKKRTIILDLRLGLISSSFLSPTTAAGVSWRNEEDWDEFSLQGVRGTLASIDTVQVCRPQNELKVFFDKHQIK